MGIAAPWKLSSTLDDREGHAPPPASVERRCKALSGGAVNPNKMNEVALEADRCLKFHGRKQEASVAGDGDHFLTRVAFQSKRLSTIAPA